jgi:hypothetical protein
MSKVLVDKSDLLAVIDNLQYFVSYGFVTDDEQVKEDQETLDRLKKEIYA